ncbi:MAG: hypothetical protein ABJD07_09685 [Gemmatimonadaceae bacterium]
MQEQMFAELLVFLFGTTVVITIARVALKFVESKRRLPTTPTLDQHLDDRLARIEQITESTAIEVERISEAQRFTTKLLSDRASTAAELRVTSRTTTPH